VPEMQSQSSAHGIPRTRYTLTNTVSGEVVGYAEMFMDEEEMTEKAQLLSWQKNPVEEQAMKKPLDHRDEGYPQLDPGSLASDLDISEDSSVNTTEDDAVSSPGDKFNKRILKTTDSDFNSNISKSNLVEEEVIIIDDPNDAVSSEINSSSTSTSFSSSLPSSVPTMPSTTQSLVAEIAAQVTGKVSSVRMGVSGKRAPVNESELTEQPLSNDSNSNKFHSNFAPGKPGRYQAFYTTEDVPQAAGAAKNRSVRCLLCKERKILKVANFGDHMKAYHEPPVNCPNCRREYRRGSKYYRTHVRTCQPRPVQDKGLVKEVKEEAMEVEIIEENVKPGTSFQALPKDKMLILDASPVSHHDDIEDTSDDDDIMLHPALSKSKGQSADGGKVTITVTNDAQKEMSLVVALRRGSKTKKAMKMFRKEFNVSKKGLKFKVCGVRLSGEELVEDLAGGEILVTGEFQVKVK